MSEAAPRNTEGSEDKNKQSGKRSKAKGSDGEEQSNANLNHSSARKGISTSRRNEEGAEEEDGGTPAPPQGKKGLVRRLNSNGSLQLAREKEKEKGKQAEVSSSSRKLIRHTSGKVPALVTVGEKEDLDDKKENITAEPPSSAPKPSLLKTTRGDARTRVKAKSAQAKARELYSDTSKDEVVGIVEAKKEKDRGKVRGKAAVAAKRGKPGRKAKQVEC